MKVFVAGASGAIGLPLIRMLIEAGHEVQGLSNSERGERTILELGASVVRASAFDAPALDSALREFQPEVVIDELTALPAHPAQMAEAAAGDRRVRLEGGGNLYHAAEKAGVRRYFQQSSAFFLAPGKGLGEESTPLAVNASPGVAASAQTYTALEERVLRPSAMKGTALRYGFFYGPGTWYDPDGAAAAQARAGELPIVGDGEGLWSWVHIDDAARGTVQALDAPNGVYQLTDDRPLSVSEWLPAFAKFVDAPPPVRMPVEQVLRSSGEDAVYYATRLRGAGNRRAREVLGFDPRPHEWLEKRRTALR